MKSNVKCKSGLRGWQGKLHEVYTDYQQFVDYASIFDIHRRLGFSSMERCWQANPTVQGSVDPSDLRRVRPTRGKCKKCGADLVAGLCTDLTCPYSEHRQKETIKYDVSEQQRRDEKHGLYGGKEDVAN